MTFEKTCQKFVSPSLAHKSLVPRWEIGRDPKEMCSNLERPLTGLPRIIYADIFIHLEFSPLNVRLLMAH